MVFPLESKGFDVEPPAYFPTAQMQNIPPLLRNALLRWSQPPLPERLMDLDDVGLYILQYRHPGSINPITGIAIDYAFRVGRRSVFGYALSRLLAPRERDVTAAFWRQFAFLMALPHRYREAIIQHDQANPQSPITPQVTRWAHLHNTLCQVRCKLCSQSQYSGCDQCPPR